MHPWRQPQLDCELHRDHHERLGLCKEAADRNNLAIQNQRYFTGISGSVQRGVDIEIGSLINRQRKDRSRYPAEDFRGSGEIPLRRDDAVLLHFPDKRIFLAHTFSSEAVVLIVSSTILNPVISSAWPNTLCFGQ